MLGKSKRILPNDGLMVIYHGTINKHHPKTNPTFLHFLSAKLSKSLKILKSGVWTGISWRSLLKMGKTFVDKSYMGFFRSQSFRRGTTTENVLNGSRDAFVFRPIRWFQGSFFPDMKPRRRKKGKPFLTHLKGFLEMISLEENRKN